MTIPITIVTLTAHNRPELLQKCVESVRIASDNLEQFSGVRPVHEILECPSAEQFHLMRVAALTAGHEYVAFVDDDDTIYPDSLVNLVAAIEATGASVAFTSDEQQSLSGVAINSLDIDKRYENVAKHPQTIHHLCLMKAADVDVENAKALHEQFGVGIDWFLKASVALKHSAVYVPMVGYTYTQHPNSLSKVTGRLFSKQSKAMKLAIVETWGTKTGEIPMFGDVAPNL